MDLIYIINAFTIGFILFPEINTGGNVLNVVPVYIIQMVQLSYNRLVKILEESQGPDIFNWGLTRMESEHYQQFFFLNCQIRHPTPYQRSSQTNQENMILEHRSVFLKGCPPFLLYQTGFWLQTPE